MGEGHPDLYKAFCWRFWHLTATDGGRIGVVLPRSVLAAKGSTDFRLAIFGKSESVDVTMLLNNRQWVFPEVHPQYSIGLVCVAHGAPTEKSIRLRGPYASLAAFSEGVQQPATAFDHDRVLAWNDTASVPLLPTEGSVKVFEQLRKSPRLDLDDEISGLFKPFQGDVNTTNARRNGLIKFTPTITLIQYQQSKAIGSTSGR